MKTNPQIVRAAGAMNALVNRLETCNFNFIAGFFEGLALCGGD